MHSAKSAREWMKLLADPLLEGVLADVELVLKCPDCGYVEPYREGELECDGCLSRHLREYITSSKGEGWLTDFYGEELDKERFALLAGLLLSVQERRPFNQHEQRLSIMLGSHYPLFKKELSVRAEAAQEEARIRHLTKTPDSWDEILRHPYIEKLRGRVTLSCKCAQCGHLIPWDSEKRECAACLSEDLREWVAYAPNDEGGWLADVYTKKMEAREYELLYAIVLEVSHYRTLEQQEFSLEALLCIHFPQFARKEHRLIKEAKAEIRNKRRVAIRKKEAARISRIVEEGDFEAALESHRTLWTRPAFWWGLLIVLFFTLILYLGA